MDYAITIKDAARLLKCDPRGVRNLRDKGELKVVGMVKQVSGWNEKTAVNDAQLLDFNDVKKIKKLRDAKAKGTDTPAA
jgi:hypothetical protein